LHSSFVVEGVIASSYVASSKGIFFQRYLLPLNEVLDHIYVPEMTRTASSSRINLPFSSNSKSLVSTCRGTIKNKKETILLYRKYNICRMGRTLPNTFLGRKIPFGTRIRYI
jgi:hypothetical protein